MKTPTRTNLAETINEWIETIQSETDQLDMYVSDTLGAKMATAAAHYMWKREVKAEAEKDSGNAATGGIESLVDSED